MRQSLIATLLNLFLVGLASAQNCDIHVTGFILDRATKEPLGFATIGIIEIAKGVVADSNGYFELNQLCPGDYHMQVDHLGCTSVKSFLFIAKDTSLTIFLDHHAELLREIVVEGKSGTNESQSKQMISSDMIKDHAGQSLSEIAMLASGVRSLQNGSGISKPVIHGLFGNRVAIINNGLLQAGQQWGADHAPEIDPNSANMITVVKGSDAIEYGAQALGGAVIIEAGPILQDPHLHGTAGYSFQTNGLGHTVYGRATKSYKKLDMRLTGTLKKEGDHKAPAYFLTNTGASETNASAQLNYRLNSRTQHQFYYSLFNTTLGVFAGSHISNLTDLENAIGSETPININDEFSYHIAPPKQQVVHQLLKYDGKTFFSEDSYIEWIYGIQSNHRQEFDIRRGNRSDIPALDLQLWSHAGEVKFVNQKNDFKYKWGLQARWIDNTNDPETGILPLIPDYREGNGGMYFNSQLPAGKLIFEFGGRYDLQLINVWAITNSLPREIVKREHVFHDLAVAAGLVFPQNEKSETRINNMIVRRSPEVNELYSNGLHQGIAGIEEGDWSLTPEMSIKSILTQSVLVREILHLELTAYSHLIYDYIFLKPQDELRLTIRGAFPVYRYTQSDAWIRGVDFGWIADISERFEWSAKMSMIKGSTIQEKNPLSLIPPTYISSSFSLSVDDHWKWKGTKFRIEGEYTGRQNQWDEEGELLAPPGDYLLLSARIESGFQVGSNLLHFSLHADNLLNTEYRNYLNRLRYFAAEQGRSLRINIRYEF